MVKILALGALLLRSHAFPRPAHCYYYCHCSHSLVDRTRRLVAQHRQQPRHQQQRCASVTGLIYNPDDQEDNDGVTTTKPSLDITLFTKEGCTLCDKAKDVLQSLRVEHPHTLRAIDITDDDQTIYWDKYKYDIPVLHLNGQYWTKHRITIDQARAVFDSVRETGGTFTSPPGEPDAAALERRHDNKRERR